MVAMVRSACGGAHLSCRKEQQASFTFCSCRKLEPISSAWTFCWSMPTRPL